MVAPAHGWCLAGAAATLLVIAAAQARAEDDASAWQEIETKYIFGFTTGTGIGLEGEKEVTVDSVGRFGKRDGDYAATLTKLEFEHTPTQFIQYEFGALVSSHDIRGVTDLEDRHVGDLDGAFAELRYLLVGRGPASPIGVTLSLEPEWARRDENSGARVNAYGLEIKLAADAELVANRLYVGANLLYEPEVVRGEGETERESTLGISGAASLRLSPGLLLGGEIGYFRHYDGVTPTHFTGDALFVGPTLYLQLARKAFMTGAFAAQVAGRDVESPAPLNLSEFSRYKARLKFAYEF